MPTIVEVDTRTFLAHYIPSEDRVEISKYLHEYKELHDFCLNHELDHAKQKPYSLRHLWIDLRDRTKFFFNTTLLKQKHNFEKPLQPKTLKAALFLGVCNLVGGLLQGFVMLFGLLWALVILLVARVTKSDRLHGLKTWASAIWE